MNREDIIAMAREAGAMPYTNRHYPDRPAHAFGIEQLERFATLVTAAKDEEHKEAMRWDVHSCGPTCKRYACVATREAVEAEREACAQVCVQVSKDLGGVAEGPFVTDFGKHTHMSMAAGAENCAAAIRARGQA